LDVKERDDAGKHGLWERLLLFWEDGPIGLGACVRAVGLKPTALFYYEKPNSGGGR